MVLSSLASDIIANSVLLNAFIVSFLGNAIPYMTVPYLAVIAGYGAAITEPAEKLAVVVFSGLGAGLGKVVVYLIGRGARLLVSEDRRRILQLVTRIAGRSLFLAVFLFAALPLPDDILYLPLGLMGYSLASFTVAVILGKIVITAAAVALGTSISILMGNGNSILAGIVAAVVGVALSVVIARMDWVKIVEAYEKRGVRAALQAIIDEALRAIGVGRTGSGVRSANAGQP